MTIKDFIGQKVIYDRDGQMIFGVDKNGGMQLLLDVRGWGAISSRYLRDGKSQEDAGKFQDEFGQWIADALNEKLKAG